MIHHTDVNNLLRTSTKTGDALPRQNIRRDLRGCSRTINRKPNAPPFEQNSHPLAVGVVPESASSPQNPPRPVCFRFCSGTPDSGELKRRDGRGTTSLRILHICCRDREAIGFGALFGILQSVVAVDPGTSSSSGNFHIYIGRLSRRREFNLCHDRLCPLFPSIGPAASTLVVEAAHLSG